MSTIFPYTIDERIEFFFADDFYTSYSVVLPSSEI